MLASVDWSKLLLRASGLGDLFFTLAVLFAVYVICRGLLRVEERLARLELKTGWISVKRTGAHQLTVEGNLVVSRQPSEDNKNDEVRNVN